MKYNVFPQRRAQSARMVECWETFREKWCCCTNCLLFCLFLHRDIWKQSEKCRQHKRPEEEKGCRRESAGENPQISGEEAPSVENTWNCAPRSVVQGNYTFFFLLLLLQQPFPQSFSITWWEKRPAICPTSCSIPSQGVTFHRRWKAEAGRNVF